MKKYILLLSLIFVLNLSFSQTTPVVKKGPEITFLNTIIDYDTIERYSNGTRTFHFYNTGDEPLIVTKVKSGCSCTVASYTKDTIFPGGRGEISATYNTRKYNAFNRDLTVYSNAKNLNPAKLWIKGFIIDPVKMWGVEKKQ